MSRKPFLWVIVEPNGTPWMSESCVCQDREPLIDDVRELNADREIGQGRYTVVALYRREAGPRRKAGKGKRSN